MNSFPRRVCSVIVSLFVLLNCTQAFARDFVNLGLLQRFIEKYSPEQLAATGPHYVEMEGIISEIHWCNANNHYQMTLLVDDPKAIPPTGSDSPQLIVHFRLHLDEMPFKVGDTITVFGPLNEMYSSVILPFIQAKTINGTEDF